MGRFSCACTYPWWSSSVRLQPPWHGELIAHRPPWPTAGSLAALSTATSRTVHRLAITAAAVATCRLPSTPPIEVATATSIPVNRRARRHRLINAPNTLSDPSRPTLQSCRHRYISLLTIAAPALGSTPRADPHHHPAPRHTAATARLHAHASLGPGSSCGLHRFVSPARRRWARTIPPGPTGTTPRTMTSSKRYDQLLVPHWAHVASFAVLSDTQTPDLDIASACRGSMPKPHDDRAGAT